MVSDRSRAAARMRAHRFLAVLAGDAVVRVGHRLHRLVVDVEAELDALVVELLRLRRRVDVLQIKDKVNHRERARGREAERQRGREAERQRDAALRERQSSYDHDDPQRVIHEYHHA